MVHFGVESFVHDMRRMWLCSQDPGHGAQDITFRYNTCAAQNSRLALAQHKSFDSSVQKRFTR